VSRESAQFAQLVQSLLRQSRGRLGWPWVLAIGVGLVLYALVIQPMAERRGIPLPPLVSQNEAPRGPAEPRRPDVAPRASSGDAAIDLVLSGSSRAPYESPGGLVYTRGSEHGHRLRHVLAHTLDEPNQPGQHGVFDDDDPAAVVALIDKAYAQALAGKRTRTEREGDRTVYSVGLGRRIGYVGGESGARQGHPAATGMRIVVEGDRLITAFPVRE